MDERIYQDLVGGLIGLTIGIVVPGIIYMLVYLYDRYLCVESRE